MSSEGSNTASIHLGYAHIVSEDVDILMFLLMHWHPQSWYVRHSIVSDEDLDKL